MPTKFSSKQIVTAVVVFLAVVLVIGYIIFSLIVEDQELSEKGVSKDTKPPQTREAWMAGAKTGNEFFDPSKKKFPVLKLIPKLNKHVSTPIIINAANEI